MSRQVVPNCNARNWERATVERRTSVTCWRSEQDERSRHHNGMPATRVKQDCRYLGPVPRTARYVKTANCVFLFHVLCFYAAYCRNNE